MNKGETFETVTTLLDTFMLKTEKEFIGQVDLLELYIDSYCCHMYLLSYTVMSEIDTVQEVVFLDEDKARKRFNKIKRKIANDMVKALVAYIDREC